MKIAVLYNKPADRFRKDDTHLDAETDTELSAFEVRDALLAKGADVSIVSVTEHTIESGIRSIQADLVFNLIEWTGTDEPLAMAAFDALSRLGLPVTGATKKNYFETCDKTITKRLCRSHGLPTAKWQEFISGDEPVDPALVYPVLVKVSREHSSVGITTGSVARSAVELAGIVPKRIREFRQPVFAETFLAGREFQVTLIHRADGLAVLPPAEIVYTAGTDVPLLTYASRWDESHHDYSNSDVTLASLDQSLQAQLYDICRRAFLELGFRDYARFDIRCDGNGLPFILELNSNPGLGDDDEYGMTLSYKAAGMTFADFIWEIVGSAKEELPDEYACGLCPEIRQ